MRRLLWVTALVATLILTGRYAGAQQRLNSSYVMAGIAFPRQEGVTGEQSQIYVAAPGGATVGWMAAAGVFVARGLSLEGELSSTSVMRAREPSRYGMTYNEERRDRFFAANVRFHIPAGVGVRLEPLVGLVLIKHERWSQTEYTRYWAAPGQEVVVGPRVRQDLPSRAGLTAGIDLRMGGRRMAVVPSLRIRIAGTGEEILSAYPGGFPRWTISPGVSARVDF